MASIILNGVLKDPASEFSVGDKVRFTHKSTTGDTIKSAASVFTVPPDGSYAIELQYGLIHVDYMDCVKRQWHSLGVVTVNQDSTATSLPELLNAIVPPTDEQLLEFQAILADCVTAKDEAEQSATEAAQSAQALNSIRYSKLDNPLTHLFKKNKLVDTLGGELTWTRESGATYIDRNGVLKYSPSPYATNLLLWSEDFSNAVWNTINSATLTHGVPTDRPSLSATRISSAVAQSESVYGVSQSPASIVISDSYMFSVWLRGSKDGLRVRLGQNHSQHTVIVTSEWERYSLPFAADTTSMSIHYISDGDLSEYLDIDMAQLEKSPVANGYVKTEATSVSGKTNMSIDQSRQEKDGWLIEGSSTNLLLSSEAVGFVPNYDPLVSVIASTTRTDEVGNPSSVTGDASKVVLKAGGGLSVRAINFSPLVVGDMYTVSIWVYIPSGQMAETWYSFDHRDTGGTTPKQKLTVFDKWVRLEGSFTAKDLGGLSGWIDVTFTPASIGGAVPEGFILYADCMQLEALPFASSYIPTEDSSVTRLGDAVSIPISNYASLLNPDGATYAVKAHVFKADAGADQKIFSVATSSANETALDFDAGGNVKWDAGDAGWNVMTPNLGETSIHAFGISTATENKSQLIVGDSSNTLNVSIADDTDLTDITDIDIGNRAFGVDAALYGHLQDFRIYDFALNEAEVKFLAGE